MAINKILYTNVADTLQGTYESPFDLTSYADGNLASLTIAAGTVEFIGGYPYRVESGAESITDGGVADGTVYVYITDPGTGVAAAALSATAPTWDANRNGYYNGASKAVFIATKVTSGTASYNDRKRIIQYNGYIENLYVKDIVTESFTASQGITPASTFEGTSPTQAQIFTWLDNTGAIPNTGDAVKITGSAAEDVSAVNLAYKQYIFSFASRSSATQINFHCLQIVATTAIPSVSVSATTLTASSGVGTGFGNVDAVSMSV